MAPAPAVGASAFGGFGTQQPQQQPQQQANPHQAALHAHESASQRQEAARVEEAILDLRSKYSPTGDDGAPGPLCAFAAVLYDPLPPEHLSRGHLAAPKPPHVSDRVWNEALARNPDPSGLCPAPLVGAAALHARIAAQQEKADALASHARKLRESLEFLERAARSSGDAVRSSGVEQEALRRRLLEVMRKVEIIRCMGQPTQRAELESQRRLGEIAKQANAVAESLADVEERGRRQARAWRARGAAAESGPRPGTTELSERDKSELFDVLNEQRLGMERLGQILGKEARDAGILRKELGRSSSSGSAGMGTLPPAGAPIFGGR